jgi:hypothetical protein
MSRPRRWVTFSLGSLFLLVAVAAYLCKRTLDTVQLYAGQLDVAAEFLDMNPAKLRDELEVPSSIGRKGTFVQLSAPSGRMKDMADWMDLAYQADIRGITLSGERYSMEQTVEKLNQLPMLKTIWFDDCEIDGSVVELLADMKQLERIRFENTNITEEMGRQLKYALPDARVYAVTSEHEREVTMFDFP